MQRPSQPTSRASRPVESFSPQGAIICFEDVLIPGSRNDVATMRRQACTQAWEEVSEPLQLVAGQSACNRRRCPGRAHRLARHDVLVLPGRVQAAGAQDQHLSSACCHRHGLLLQPRLLPSRCRRQALRPGSLRNCLLWCRSKAVDPR
jgi:hypothetical protein